MIDALLPALIPAATDGLRGLFAMITGNRGAKPQNVQEAINLSAADTARLQALAQLDNPIGEISLWANNIRSLQRPFASAIVLISYIVSVTLNAPIETQLQLGEYAAMVTFYLFGDRTYMHFKNKP